MEWREPEDQSEEPRAKSWQQGAAEREERARASKRTVPRAIAATYDATKENFYKSIPKKMPNQGLGFKATAARTFTEHLIQTPVGAAFREF